MAWSPRQAWAARLNAATPPNRAWLLLSTLGPQGLERGGDEDWARACEARHDAAASWRRAALSFDVASEERRAGALGARLLVRGDADYPQLLECTDEPPLVLYVQGTLAARPVVGVVGSRKPTAYGRRQARRLAGDIARRGLIVVSGLAWGVDAEAHRAALDAKGISWAVLGTGLSHVYPAEHRDLARRLLAGGGAVISEMPCETRPQRELFPRRNRIVAGLSWAVVVVEGRHKSGSLITARLAGEYGREVLAVPGPADSPLSEAPHRLLAQGAALAAVVDDIIAVLPPGVQLEARPEDFSVRAEPSSASREEARILALLGGDSLSLDELVQLTGLDTGHISSIMFGLEAKERVSFIPGQRYAQKTAR
ncbi:MAG: DNA-protecting protein DprA [Elusimicrobia bacterium]|nr:DNA-protecting protein DprA [Elusimicrobiota bacterium]